MLELCQCFIKSSRKFCYSPYLCQNILSLVEKLFTGDVIDILQKMSDVAKENIYYVSGWSINMITRVSRNRTPSIAKLLTFLVSSVSLEKSDQHSNLPTGKVDRRNKFNSLRYANQNYFSFVVRLENVFCELLDEKSLMMFGSFTIK